MITLVGIISKNDEVLYLKTYKESAQEEAYLIGLAYSACDIFRERRDQEIIGSYYGSLIVLPEVVLFGAMSSTQIKFIVAIEKLEIVINHTKIHSVLDQLQMQYVNAGKLERIRNSICSTKSTASNPFHLARLDDQALLSSPKLDRAVEEIVTAW